MIGRKCSDKTVQEDKKMWPFKIVEDSKGNAAIEVQFKKQKQIYTPEEISAAVIFRKKKRGKKIGLKKKDPLTPKRSGRESFRKKS